MERNRRQKAAAALSAEVPGLRVDFNEISGSPSFISSNQGFLVPQVVSPAGTITPGEAQAVVKSFVDAHPALFGSDSKFLAASRLVRDYETPHNGMRTMVWQQELEGIPIFESTLQASVTKRGELINVASQLIPDPASAAQNPPAVVDVKQAISSAAETVGENVPPAQIVENAPPAGATRSQSFRANRLLEVSAQYVWLPMDQSTLRLSWEVLFTSKQKGEMFRTLVDAATGEAVVRQRLTEYLTPASYRVFTNDSPAPMSPGLTSPASTQPAEVARNLVTLDAFNATASPNGWIDDGVNETRGNNVDAHLDLDADNVADLPRPQGSPNRVFDFSLNLTQAPSAYRDAAVTNLFYWVNFIHDRYYLLGFTEAAGNFQNNNFSRGGRGNDAVQADAQDGSGTNNANFSTPTDGSPGRMQMYVFTGPNPDRDGDFDQEIIIHEYTHGLSNRLVGGGVGISSLQTRGMGEGWSDFYALCLLSSVQDDPNGVYASGAYASYQLSGLTQNYYYGIRRYPYTTDLTKNPLTFKDISIAQASNHTGIPRSPVAGNTANEVHNVGEVWCVTLWEARANLIAKWGAAAGNELILQLVTDGMKLAPANPNFLQARDAILQADLVNSSGVNRNELWAAFAKRGMGTSATSPASTLTEGIFETFDAEGGALAVSSGALTTSGPAGGPFSPSSKSYTVVNTGTVSLNWSVQKSAAWVGVLPAAGTLAPQASVTVTATINASANSLSYGSYSDTLTFSSTEGSAGTFPKRQIALAVKANAPPYHVGWPKTGSGQFTTLADLDHDGKMEILVASGSSLFVYRENGATYPGWPQTLLNAPVGPPSVGDMDGDGTEEIAVAGNNYSTRNGSIQLWRSNGTAVANWPKTLISDNPFISYNLSPCLADIDGDGKLEVIYTSSVGSRVVVNVVKMDGTPVPGWPVTVTGSGSSANATPAIADFDGDGRLDIAFVTFGNQVYVLRNNGTVLSGFPKSLGSGGNPSGSVTFADVDHNGTLELIANVWGGEMAIYDGSGQTLSGWPKTFGSASIPRGPAVADLDGDGNLELVLGTQTGSIYVMNYKGVNLTGWPQSLASRVYWPAIVDIDGDGAVDIVAVDGSCTMSAWKISGEPLYLLGFPFSLGGANGAGPALIADLDGDSKLELIAPGESWINVRDLDVAYRPELAPWPRLYGSATSISRFAPAPTLTSVTPSSVDSIVPAQVVLAGDHFLKGMSVWIGGVKQTVVSENESTISVQTSGLQDPGPQDIVVANANFAPVTFPGALTVNAELRLALPSTAIETAGVLAAQGEVSIPQPLSANLVVTLQSSDISEVQVPASVTIPAGQTAATFDVTIVDDSELDGAQTAVITATDSRSNQAIRSIVVTDNETASLSLAVAPTATEGSSPIQATLSVSTTPSKNVTISLSSSDSAEIQVPSTVVIPAGQNSVNFPVTIVNDTRIDGTVVTTITAQFGNWAPDSAQIAVADDESRSLVVSFPAQTQEGAGNVTGSVQLSGTLPGPIVVSLSSSNTSKLMVPSSVTIPAGQTSGAFAASIVNDNLTDGTQSVTITATASGFTSGTATTSVLDNDPHHFSISTIGGVQVVGTPFTVSVTARDSDDAILTSYSGTPNLTATGSSGAVTVTPTSLGIWNNGVWTGTVNVPSVASNVVLTVKDGAGALGTSNAFNVGFGGVHHFAWSTVASPQAQDTLIPVILTAQDVGNNTVSNFSGNAALNLETTYLSTKDTGIGTSNWDYPLHTSTHDARVTSLYLASEIGNARRINSLAFDVSGVPSTTLSAWTIRLKQTALTNLASATWETTGWTTAYQGNVTISQTGWVTFQFTTPFDYDGTSNLLVDFSFNNSTSSYSGAVRSTVISGPSRSRYYAVNSTAGDPLLWSSSTPSTLTSLLPNLRLGGSLPSASIPMQPSITGNFVNGVWSGDVSVPFASDQVSLVAQVGTATGRSNVFAVQAPGLPLNSGNTVLNETFESGTLGPWWKITGTNTFRTEISAANSPHGGSAHLVMDSSASFGEGTYARNEATLEVNLAGRTGVVLKFWAKGFGDEPHVPPTSPFTGGADFDGVAISVDGTKWYEVQSLRSLPSTYLSFSIDLDAFMAVRGLSYTSTFKIRFNQYDNSPVPSDGIAIDDILLTATPRSGVSLSVPAQVTETAGSISGTVTLPSSSGSARSVTLSSSANARITLPASVTIPAGQTTANFTIAVVNNMILDGDRSIDIMATVSGLGPGLTSMLVKDDDISTVSLTLPASATEGASGVTGTATLGQVPSGPLTFTLTSTDTSEVTVPGTITFPAGQTSVSVPLTIVNDSAIDGPQNVSIIISALGWSSSSKAMTILDNSAKTLALSFPFSVPESQSANGTVTITGTWPSTLVVNLTSSDPSRLTVPATVSIPAGSVSADFTTTAVDNSLTDGGKTATITATADQFTSVTRDIRVRDDDVHHFAITFMDPIVVANKRNSVRIYALDANDDYVYTYNRTVSLTARNSDGPLSLPFASATLSNGSWTDAITFTSTMTGVTISATDGVTTSVSASFDVVVGPLTDISWTPIAPFQKAGRPFDVTLSARDAFGNLIPSLNERVWISSILSTSSGTSEGSYAYLASPTMQQRDQIIYLPGEVGTPGLIKKMAFQLNTASSGAVSGTMPNFTVRLKYTNLADYDSAPVWETADWQTVYRGDLFVSPGLVEIPLTTPFYYDGTRSLMVDVSHNGASSGVLSTTTATPNRSRRTLSFYGSSLPDPLTWSGSTTQPPTVGNSLPYLKFIKEGSVSLSPASVMLGQGSWSGALVVDGKSSDLILNARLADGTGGASGTLSVGFEAPVLAEEPGVTGGRNNTVVWSAVTGASQYEAQTAPTPTFDTVSSSGAVMAQSYTFADLSDGQTYSYRVRAQRQAPGGQDFWAQTTRSQFLAGDLMGVFVDKQSVTLDKPTARSLIESFDEAGSSWNSTVFSSILIANGMSRNALDSSHQAPARTPALPVNQGGDLEGVFAPTIAAIGARTLMPSNPENVFVNGTIEGYFAFGLQNTFGTLSTELKLRSSSDFLNGCTAILSRENQATARLSIVEKNNGVYGTAQASGTFSADFSSENYRVRFTAHDTLLTASVWRVTSSDGVVTETPVVFDQGSTILVGEGKVTPGVVGFDTSGSIPDKIMFDDFTISMLDDEHFVPNGTFTSPIIAPSYFNRWNVLRYNAATPPGTGLSVDVLHADGTLLAANVPDGTDLNSIPTVAGQSALRLRANLSTADNTKSPALQDWSVAWFNVAGSLVSGDWSNIVQSTQDSTPPVVTITSPAAASTFAHTLVGTATDAHGIASVTVNGEPVSSSDGFAHWSFPAALRTGSNVFTVVVRDNVIPPNTTTLDWNAFATFADLDDDKLPDTWEAQYGLTGSDSAGKNGALGDFDGDGLANILEYVGNLDPSKADATPFSWTTMETNPADGQKYLVVHYRQRSGLMGLNVSVETSTNLSGWSSSSSATESAAEPTLLSDGQTRVFHRRILPPTGAATDTRNFVRLRITPQ